MKIPCHLLEFNDHPTNSATEFFKRNLDELLEQENAAHLILKKALCNKDLCVNQEHNVAIATDDLNIELTGNFLAALPCPPHCGSKLESGYVDEKISIANYLALLP